MQPSSTTPPPSRRAFLQTLGASAASAAGIPLLSPLGSARALDDVGPTPNSPAETAVARLFQSLKPDQRKLLCFPFDHPLRSRVGNNWAIVKPTIGDLTRDQQAICKEIFHGLLSEEGIERYTKHMEDDAGGFENYHVALFGEPGSNQPFEWVLTGRHETIRADGNSVDGVAFGGPIFYGHDVTGTGTDDPRHTGNVWWFQGEQANKIFQSLDQNQKSQALVAAVPADEPQSIKLKGDSPSEQGIPIATLDPQQKKMVVSLIDCLVRPYRKIDVDEVRACLDGSGGIDQLRLTFYKEGNLGDDDTWDNWKLEGPAFAWFFRCSPHAHVWLNVARNAQADLIPARA
jgi:hypothetical protein